jgi:2-succinyl-6-hydroxy-2,4-cyclohexadiene-1-carboxylate synthase
LLEISFLHGFLGSPKDWEGVVEHLPQFQCHLLKYPFKVEENTILVGYSMGGRIALRYPNPKIVIAAHPGLCTEEEKKRRWQDDQKWIDRFEHEPLCQVLKEWYDQPLFHRLKSAPCFEEVYRRRLQQKGKVLAKILRKESLAHQTFIKPANTLFLYGAHDVKFAQLYLDRKLPCLEIPEVGHAAHLEDPRATAAAILTGLLRLKF